MPVTVELATHLDCTPDEAWEQVQNSALVQHVAAPLIRFTPRGEPFPAHWQPREYRAWMWLYGVIPLGWQAVVISYPAAEGTTRYLRDNGYSPSIRRWDHRIAISPQAEGGTLYVDRVEIEAGLLTPLIAAFARVFYDHRQRRWRALARDRFAALER
jgi:hypothetical protein